MNNFIKKIKDFLKFFWKDPMFLNRWERDYYSRQKEDNKLSVGAIGRGSGRYFYSGSSHMFIEDMYTGIMPFMIYAGEREKYPSKVEPSSPKKEGIIAEGISERGNRRFLTDALCNFIRTTTHILFQNGVVFYEIVYEKDELGETKSFEFESIHPFYLFKFFKNYYQIIPWWVAKECHVKVQVIKIPVEKILRIDFPKQFGGRRKIKKTLKRMWQLSKELVPKFQMDAMSKNEDFGFNLKDFNKAEYLEIAKFTKDFGWSQRQFTDNYVAEYYSWLRFLRKKKIEAVIRDKIISQLNIALNGSVLKLGVNVAIENIFSVEDVRNKEESLKAGDIAFIDIFNFFKIT
jgi:hypothetical protein